MAPGDDRIERLSSLILREAKPVPACRNARGGAVLASTATVSFGRSNKPMAVPLVPLDEFDMDARALSALPVLPVLLVSR